MARSALSLYQATNDAEYLNLATEWVNIIITQYKSIDGGYSYLPSGSNEISGSLKEMNDDPLPSGNSLILEVLIKLKAITGTDAYDSEIDSQIDYFTPTMLKNSLMLTAMLNAYDLHSRNITVTFRGDPNNPKLQEFISEVSKIPTSSILFKREAVNEDPHVLLCKNFTCSAPLTDITEIKQQLLKLKFN